MDQHESTPDNSSNSPPKPIHSYASYPFSSDETYQQGLASILAGNNFKDTSSSDAREEILRRTRVFYFNKMTGNSLTIDEVREYETSILTRDVPQSAPSGAATVVGSSNQSSHNAQETSADETRVLTLAELKELIETGRVDQIPNNKIIPEGVNEAPPSISTTPVKKKPWEKDNVTE